MQSFKTAGRERGHFNFRAWRVSEGDATKIVELQLSGSTSPKPACSVWVESGKDVTSTSSNQLLHQT